MILESYLKWTYLTNSPLLRSISCCHQQNLCDWMLQATLIFHNNLRFACDIDSWLLIHILFYYGAYLLQWDPDSNELEAQITHQNFPIGTLKWACPCGKKVFSIGPWSRSPCGWSGSWSTSTSPSGCRLVVGKRPKIYYSNNNSEEELFVINETI